MSSPAVEPPGLGSWCGLTWRRSSANDGPGSILGENRGNGLGSGIGRGAYRRASTRQGKPPLPRECREVVILGEVGSRGEQPFSIFVNEADRDIARKTENAAHSTSVVVMID